MKFSQQEISYTDNTTNVISIWEGTRTGIVRIMMPAMGVRASYYHGFAEQLTTAKGGTTITVDLRGLGNSSIRPSRDTDFGYREYIRDLNELIGHIRGQYKVDKMVTIGHSLGGQIACLHASRYPDVIAHTTIIATCLPYYRSWKFKDQIRLMIAGNTFYPLSKVFGYFPGEMTGFAGRESMTVMKDWAHGVRKGKYYIMNTDFDYENAMRSYPGTITSISYFNDNLSSEEAVCTLLDKFQSSKEIRKYIIEDFDHFNWARDPGKTIQYCI